MKDLIKKEKKINKKFDRTLDELTNLIIKESKIFYEYYKLDEPNCDLTFSEYFSSLDMEYFDSSFDYINDKLYNNLKEKQNEF